MRPCPSLGAAALALSVLAACSGGGSAGAVVGGSNRLVRVDYGLLADVYAERDAPGGRELVLVRRDAVVDPRAGAAAGRRAGGAPLQWLGGDPTTCQPRIVVPFAPDTAELARALAELEAGAVPVEPGGVVPRNAALRLTFARALAVDEAFFFSRDALGRPLGTHNPDAVALFAVRGDGPPSPADLEALPVRIALQGDRLVLDPVLIGEGGDYGYPDTPDGLPAAADRALRIRLALPVEGPLRLPSLGVAAGPGVGVDDHGRTSVVRDFATAPTAGHRRGRLPDDVPPGLLLEHAVFVAAVDAPRGGRQRVAVWKDGAAHDIDRGDALALPDPRDPGRDVVALVLADPVDDHGRPAAATVWLTVTPVPGLAALDPRRDPSYPADPGARPQWLRDHAVVARLVAAYEPGRDSVTAALGIGNSSPFAGGRRRLRLDRVSPFASFGVRFDEPVDLATVRPHDTLFVATRDLRPSGIAAFAAERGLDPAAVDPAKVVTPHLVASRIRTDGGHRRAVRLEPVLGLYLDEEMRQVDEGRPFEQKRFRYFVHLRGGERGIRDAAGNPLQLPGAEDGLLVVPFALDTGRNPSGRPAWPDNPVVSVVRRFAAGDEDERPSLYLDHEAPLTGAPVTTARLALADAFGAVTYLHDETLIGRPTARLTRIVDDLNQPATPPQTSPARHCPAEVAGEEMIVARTAGARFSAPLANPWNPAGARLQSVWRDLDLALARDDPDDFNLDVEAMYWAPFSLAAAQGMAFDAIGLFFGHAEHRPEPCVGAFSGLLSMGSSGLQSLFEDNYAANVELDGTIARPAPHRAYEAVPYVVDTSRAVPDPHGRYRYLPLPAFERPYFVWRDETAAVQGGSSGTGADVANPNDVYDPYVHSPWNAGMAWRWGADGGRRALVPRFFDNQVNYQLRETSRRDTSTGGSLPAVALPLLADFRVYPSTSGPSVGGAPGQEGGQYRGPGDVGLGGLGWQTSLGVASAPMPNFRAFSGGTVALAGGQPVLVGPGTAEWVRAAGGFTPTGGRTNWGDNTVLWTMIDFLKRQSVATFGFVELTNPHRVPARAPSEGDPRLGPYLDPGAAHPALPPGVLPAVVAGLEPERVPAGAEVVVEYRAASRVDDEPWRWRVRSGDPADRPTADNFALDPWKAGDAHLRKFDDRLVGAEPRNGWAHYYNRHVTAWAPDPSRLFEPAFLRGPGRPADPLRPEDLRYLGWRFVLRNGTDRAAAAPVLGAFWIAYRFER